MSCAVLLSLNRAALEGLPLLGLHFPSSIVRVHHDIGISDVFPRDTKDESQCRRIDSGAMAGSRECCGPTGSYFSDNKYDEPEPACESLEPCSIRRHY
jgi:hypothetical protein